jgi:hypothetical protein
LFGALNGDYKFGYFSGGAMATTLEGTSAANKFSAMLNWASPMDDSPDGTLSLSVRDQLSDTKTFNAGQAKKASGRVPTRGKGKVVAYKREIPASSSWTYAKGVNYVEANTGGPR